MMLFAQAINSYDAPVAIGAWLGCLLFVVMLINACGKLYDRFTGKSKVPQPMNVEIVKALHDQFADKIIFEKHVSHNTGRHSEIFREIERVEREARIELERKLAELNEERRRTLEKLNNRNERIMFALGKIASKLNVAIEPTE